MKIVAPTNCVLEVLSVKVGDVLAPNQSIATLLLTNHIWCASRPEPRPGHPKPATPCASAWMPSTKISRASSSNREAEFTPRNVQTVGERAKQVFGVKVKLDNSEG